MRYPIPTPAPGQLSTMTRPRGGDWLDTEMAVLAADGVDVLVCLLTTGELDELDLADEAAAAARAGLEFHRLPVTDFGVPDRAAARPLLDLLHQRLVAGHDVAVHCRAGIGRSSVIAAACLVGLGVERTEVWRIIATARGVPVPETDEQRAWLADG
ncbi:protein-tyrosine phosphatase family protein [Solwaraspora sp. WMMB335]|uniref:protein-tyrosine phosphatase family protein n=1 Tax=Solwaraspora sp. WMMB335 TaxID=3404118 RepID=UPI003B923424